MLTDLDNEALKCADDSCHALDKDWSWSQKDSIFTVTQTLNDRHRLIAKGYSTGKDYFGKLTFSVEDTENSGGPSSALALSLFATSCDP